MREMAGRTLLPSCSLAGVLWPEPVNCQIASACVRTLCVLERAAQPICHSGFAPLSFRGQLNHLALASSTIDLSDSGLLRWQVCVTAAASHSERQALQGVAMISPSEECWICFQKDS